MNKHSSKCFYSSVWQSSLHLLPLLLFLLNLFLSSFSSFLHLTSFPLPLSPSLLFTSSLSISVYSFSPPISPSPSLSALSSTSSLTISFSSFLHLYVLLLLFSLSTPPPLVKPGPYPKCTQLPRLPSVQSCHWQNHVSRKCRRHAMEPRLGECGRRWVGVGGRASGFNCPIPR